MSQNVTKEELCQKIARKHGMSTPQVAVVVNELFRTLKGEFAIGREAEIRGFGVFRLSQRESLVAQNLHAGRGNRVRKHRYINVRFKAGRALKEKMAGLERRLAARNAAANSGEEEA